MRSRLPPDSEAAWESERIHPEATENTYLLKSGGEIGSYEPEAAHDKMSPIGFVVNIIADIFPMGFLPLAFGLRYAGVLHVFIVSFLLYFTSMYTMWAIGRTCYYTGLSRYSHQWEFLFGKRTSWIPLVVVGLSCFGCSVVTLHLAAQLMEHTIYLESIICLALVTFCVVLPLGFIKDLKSLSYSSGVSLVFIAFVIAVVILRANDGSYAEGGKFYTEAHREGVTFAQTIMPNGEISITDDVTLGVKRDKIEGWPPPYWWRPPSKKTVEHEPPMEGAKFLDILGMMQVAFLIQYNGPKYWSELSKPTSQSFTKCSVVGLTLSMILYGVAAYFGYYIFPNHTPDVLLDGFARDDDLARVSRFFLACSLLMAIPLVYNGLRESINDLICLIFTSGSDYVRLQKFQHCLSVAMTLAVFLVAMCLKRLEILEIILGSVFGVGCIYVVPLLLYEAASRSSHKEVDVLDIIISRSVMVFGIACGICGIATLFISRSV